VVGAHEAGEGRGSFRDKADIIRGMPDNGFKSSPEQGNLVIEADNPGSPGEVGPILTGKGAGIVTVLTGVLIAGLATAETFEVRMMQSVPPGS